MKRIIFLYTALFIVILAALPVYAGPYEAWSADYLTHSSLKYERDVETDSSNNVFVMFNMWRDSYILKYGSSGNLQEDILFQNYNIWDIAIDKNDNIIILALNQEDNHDELFKYSPDFERQWSVPLPLVVASQFIETDSEGNVVIARKQPTGQHVAVVKFSRDGKLLWERDIVPSGLLMESKVLNVLVDQGDSIYVPIKWGIKRTITKYSPEGDIVYDSVYGDTSMLELSSSFYDAVEFDSSGNIAVFSKKYHTDQYSKRREAYILKLNPENAEILSAEKVPMIYDSYGPDYNWQQYHGPSMVAGPDETMIVTIYKSSKSENVETLNLQIFGIHPSGNLLWSIEEPRLGSAGSSIITDMIGDIVFTFVQIDEGDEDLDLDMSGNTGIWDNLAFGLGFRVKM